MHPAVGLLLERLVPKGGADLGGVWLPEDTIVGMNPWVAARDKDIYDQPYEFKPERWLDADEKQFKLMERNFLAVSFQPITAEATVIDHCFSLAEGRGPVSERTSRFWRCRSWSRNSFDGTISSSLIRAKSGRCMTTGS